MKKRFTSLLLALVMCLSLSVVAMAAEPDADPIGFYADGVVEVEVSGLIPGTEYDMISVVNRTANQSLGLGSGSVDENGVLHATITTGRIEESELSNHYVYVYNNIGGTVAASGPLALADKPEISVTGVTLDRTALEVEIGQTATLTATVEPPNATNKGVTWSSDDENVATVTGTGLMATVKGIAEGTATITVTTVDGSYTASCTVTVTAASAQPTVHTIAASAGTGGTISPSGNVSVTDGSSQTFSITANSRYEIASVVVDGVSQGAISTYTFENVTANHTITASFNYVGGSSTSYTVSVEQNDGGTIRVSPSRAERGETVTITVDPDTGYELDSISVTDSSGNAVDVERQSATEYTFEMPGRRVTVEAAFVEISEEPTPEPANLPFTDVPASAWYYDAVRFVYEQGMMSGTGNNQFSPNVTTTRAMIVTILYRLENQPTAGSSSFSDVPAGQWYTNAVAWAAANGIVGGYGDGRFGPNDTITREQMAAILYRYAQYKGYNTTSTGSLSGYTDGGQVSSWAQTAMVWANTNGLITGSSATTLNPLGYASRAEVATILMRFVEIVAQ